MADKQGIDGMVEEDSKAFCPDDQLPEEQGRKPIYSFTLFADGTIERRSEEITFKGSVSSPVDLVALKLLQAISSFDATILTLLAQNVPPPPGGFDLEDMDAEMMRPNPTRPTDFSKQDDPDTMIHRIA